MATLVYVLCALTSSLCAVLLLRRYARQRGWTIEDWSRPVLGPGPTSSREHGV